MEMEMNTIKGIIYCYTSPSNKKYIGQSINPRSRYLTFLNKAHVYSQGGKLENARKKYLPENFIYEILEEIYFEDKLELIQNLNKLEIYYIDKYNTYKNGYNSTIGGQSLFIYDLVTKNKISKAKSNNIVQYDMEGYFIQEWESAKEISKEFNCNADTIRKCCTGNAKKSLGYVWRYKTDNYPLVIDTNLSDTDKLVSKSYNYRNVINSVVYKEVIQYNIFGNFLKKYNSIEEAVSENEKVNRTSLSGCCTGKFKTSGGFIWRYRLEKDIPLVINVDNITENDIIKSTLNKKGEKPIIQYDLYNNELMRFCSITEATKVLNICRTGIYQACSGKLKTYKKFIWKYDI